MKPFIREKNTKEKEYIKIEDDKEGIEMGNKIAIKIEDDKEVIKIVDDEECIKIEDEKMKRKNQKLIIIKKIKKKK